MTRSYDVCGAVSSTHACPRSCLQLYDTVQKRRHESRPVKQCHEVSNFQDGDLLTHVRLGVQMLVF